MEATNGDINVPKRLLIAASGTGGHLFPALAAAERLNDYSIEWLGVPNRLETQLVGDRYPLHTIDIEGFQQRFGLRSLKILFRILGAVGFCRQLLQQGQFQGVLTTGGYISAPAIIAARSLGLPAIVHESNALPGKVTRWLSPWCTVVALGFGSASQFLPKTETTYVGTPVRPEFLTDTPLDLPIPPDVPLIVVMGGSQGAVAVNQIVRQCAPSWFEAGAWIVHLTGDRDPDANSLEHPQYFPMPFYDNMAGLLQRANLAVTRAGAGTLTELSVTKTPAILIPYPYAAEDHQAHNAAIPAAVGAALVFRQEQLKPETLEAKVLDLLRSPEPLEQMAASAGNIAIPDSAEQLAQLVRQYVEQ